MTDPTDFSEDNSQSSKTSSKNDSGSKKCRKRKSTALQALLDEANKYTPHQDYEMPRTFLRDKSVKIENSSLAKESIQSEELPASRKKPRKGRPRKEDTVSPLNESSSSVPSLKKPVIELGPKRKPETQKKSINSHEIRASEASAENAGIRNHTYQCDVRSTFANWKADVYDVQSDIIDFEYIKSHNLFEGSPAPSTVLTAKHREKCQKLTTVKLQSVFFENYQEEYDVCFDRDLNIYNPMCEIGKIVEYVAEIFLPYQYSVKIQNEVLYLMNKAYDERKGSTFIDMVKRYNEIISSIPRQEIITHLSRVKRIPCIFIHDFLHIVYTRSIFPQFRKLRHYEAFSNYVYGELLPGFLSEVFVKCQLAPNQIFMDLGSGVGNCVIQAALECGCDLSFGCEIMSNASDLTEAQYRELVQRCRLFGLKVPPIEYSLRQSFIGNKRVDELIPKCDVLLINNFLFDSDMNLQVEKLIQNAKVGCKIITLKNLRVSGYTINFYNLDSILNRLHVEKFELKEDSVSWTHSGGEYYISTVMENMDESLFDPSLRQRSTRRPKRYTR